MKKIFLFLVALVTYASSYAQDGKLLTSYVPQISLSYVKAVGRLSNGSLIVGGDNSGSLWIKKLLPNGQVDTSFNVTYFQDFQVSGEINSICIQSDGKILVGGSFTTVTMWNQCLFRLNSNGSVDSTFSETIPAKFVVEDVVIQPGTNKILVGGYTNDPTYVTSNKGLYRVNTNGTLDTTFNTTGVGINSMSFAQTVRDIETYANGDIIITGDIPSYNGTTTYGIVKVNANGTLSTTSFPGMGWSIFGYQDAAIEANGSIIAVSTVDGNVQRFFANGTEDMSFQPLTDGGGLYTDSIFSVAIQNDGKIIIGGMFYQVGGVVRKNIARLNTDGTLDICFDSSIGTNDSIQDMLIEPDGNIVAWGFYSTYDNIARPGLAKVRANTTVIATPDAGVFYIGSSSTVAVPNVLNNDNLNGYTPTPTTANLSQVSSTHSGITLNTSNGSVNVSSSVPEGTYTLTYKICLPGLTTACYCDEAEVQITVTTPIATGERADFFVNHSGLQSDGKIIISGGFDNYDDIPANTIARLNTDLSLDTSFNLSGPVGSNVGTADFAIQPDDYIVVVGVFEGYSGQGAGLNIARLKPDGTFDYDFNMGDGFKEYNNNASTISLALQQDGKIVVGGAFDTYDGHPVTNLARIKPDGSFDSGFDAGQDIAIPVGIIEQPDGKILVAAWMNIGNGNHIVGVIRLKDDGSLDNTFNYGTGAYPSIVDHDSHDITLQPDGKILFYGDFTKYNGVNNGSIVRLNTDGSIDTAFTFNTGTGFNGKVYSVELDANGKLVVGGDFDYFNGTPVNDVVRLNADGSLDTTFNSGTGPANAIVGTPRVQTITIQPDQKVIIGGSFKYFDGIYAGNITRLIPSTGIQGRPALGTEDFVNATDSFTIYPNPSQGIFNFELKGYDGQEFEVAIYNALGVQVHQTKVMAGNSYQLDLTNLQAGNYFVRLQNNSTTINKIIAKK